LIFNLLLNQCIISGLYIKDAVHSVLLAAVVDCLPSASANPSHTFHTTSIQSIFEITQSLTVAELPNFSIVSA
jgi:hypothetical protein